LKDPPELSLSNVGFAEATMPENRPLTALAAFSNAFKEPQHIEATAAANPFEVEGAFTTQEFQFTSSIPPDVFDANLRLLHDRVSRMLPQGKKQRNAAPEPLHLFMHPRDGSISPNFGPQYHNFDVHMTVNGLISEVLIGPELAHLEESIGWLQEIFNKDEYASLRRSSEKLFRMPGAREALQRSVAYARLLVERGPKIGALPETMKNSATNGNGGTMPTTTMPVARPLSPKAAAFVADEDAHTTPFLRIATPTARHAVLTGSIVGTIAGIASIGVIAGIEQFTGTPLPTAARFGIVAGSTVITGAIATRLSPAPFFHI
jgi:hypothetical protein